MLLLILPILYWAISHLVGHGATSETCPRVCTTLCTLMVLPTVDTHHWCLSILFCPLSLVLMVPLMLKVLLLLSLSLALHFEDLVMKVFKLIGPLNRFLKSSRWYYSGGISLNKRVKSLKEFGYLLFHGIHQLRSISTQPLELGEIFQDCHASLYKLLKLYGLLLLDVGRYILVMKLPFEIGPNLRIRHSPVLFSDCLPPSISYTNKEG